MTVYGDVQRVEAELKLILAGPPYDQDELAGSLARYACLLTSSYLEVSIRELICRYCETRADSSVMRYVANKMQMFRNPNTEKLLQVVGSFDLEVRRKLEDSITDEQKSAIDSICAQRNNIAHGRRSGISLGQVKRYHDQATGMLARVHSAMMNDTTAQQQHAADGASRRR